ncbi:pectinesterase inhibitor 12-like [Momordica charantia]|uniref:Pectinesterase inhibitor 12-like n=1 Tax=Momordica charantia TaxID=3673 RepID=A0A6J1BQY5_MOMCH|nr:pectinesterase inhibitor 12-like [Momordica charantia]
MASQACLFFVALLMAGMWYGGHAQGQSQERERELLGLSINLNLGFDICRKADYPAMCRSVVKGLNNPRVAFEAAVRQLMFQTSRAKSVAQRNKDKSSAMEVCFEVYDDAYSNLETGLSNLKSHDKSSLNVDLSAVLTDYVTCDDAINEEGITSPVTRTNAILSQMASNCLYFSSLIHLR